jgi:hypothetical protein
MEFWLNDIFHILLQYAGITEVMLNAHNDLNFVHYPNCLYKQHNIFEIQSTSGFMLQGYERILCPQGL